MQMSKSSTKCTTRPGVLYLIFEFEFEFEF